MSDMIRGFVDLIECQFQITYSSERLRDSLELREDQSLIYIRHVILKVVRDYTPCGRDGSNLLMLWLRIIGYVNLDSIDLPSLLHNPIILERLYTRGIADYSPPQLCLDQVFKHIRLINSTDRSFNLDIVGEVQQSFVVTTQPTALASLYTSFVIKDSNNSTVHNVKIVLRTPEGQDNPPMMQPLKPAPSFGNRDEIVRPSNSP
ncbi:hypothetical protein COLO4_01921 [Corchorus olitorius]|uniref:Uncharacterized protein n=1 Tax=Corchorus olitorius TaxID=93759 RepID=A0A1R3L1R9_9ROSI|nr:hypothetical protein COLO4_01921 [Corchorus olitorius]